MPCGKPELPQLIKIRKVLLFKDGCFWLEMGARKQRQMVEVLYVFNWVGFKYGSTNAKNQ